MKLWILLTILSLLSGVLAQNTAYQPDPDWHVPQEAAAKPNPLACRPEAAAGGKKLFLRNCAECHGQDGSGLVKKHAADLQLPAELTATAPAVHDAVDNSVIWRVVAARDGRYNLNIASGGESASKEVLVSSKLVRLSPERVRGSFWKRMFYSTEPALPNDGLIQAISVDYPAREVGVFTWKANWIIWFFFISLIAGFIFKSALGIEV